jgi:hypothetical protein
MRVTDYDGGRRVTKRVMLLAVIILAAVALLVSLLVQSLRKGDD